jgi:F-type H+-transporting ATPase subunit epsilon
MATLMQFEVLSPDKYVFKADDVTYVDAVTVWGGVGILPRHATMICTLKEAPLKYRDKEGFAHFICVDGGFLEVKDNKVTVLTVNAETADVIDVNRAQASFERAKNRLSNLDKDINVERVMQSLRRAEARLKTVKLAATEK